MVEEAEVLKFKRTFGPKPRYLFAQNYTRPAWSNEFIVIAGPCSVESEKQIERLAMAARGAGATHLRGGVFRAGTYPSGNFGWVQRDLIKAYHSSAKGWGLYNVIEFLDYRDTWIYDFCDVLQIGARQMQNYTLLKVAAESGKPVFLKRNPGSTLDELLGSCEWLLQHGVKELSVIERGSVGHFNHVRYDLSISMIPAFKAITQIPIIVDASHGTGRADLVSPMTLAGVAAGADGLLCEIHFDPENSISDAEQAIHPLEFEALMKRVDKIREVL